MSEPLTRPIPDAMASIEAAADKVNAIIDGFIAAGEITIDVDVLQCKSIFTLHIPLPKGG